MNLMQEQSEIKTGLLYFWSCKVCHRLGWDKEHGCPDNNNISTVEQANKEIHRYIESFNNKYAVTALDDDTFWIDPPADLEDILIAQFPRRADKVGCVSFQGTLFHAPSAPDFSRSDIVICINEHGIYAKYLGEYYPLVPVEGYVQQLQHDIMPQVVVNIIYRYLYAFGKEISA